jgi:hypothetical protein
MGQQFFLTRELDGSPAVGLSSQVLERVYTLSTSVQTSKAQLLKMK